MGVLLALLLLILSAPCAVARESAIGWNNRGVDLYSAGQYTAAIKAYEKAIKLNPKYTDAYSNRGVAYDAMNQPERAVIDYSYAIKLNPNMTAFYVNRGLAYTDLARFSDAVIDWNMVLKRNPRNADAYYRRGFCYQSMGILDKALADFEKACKLNPRLAKAVKYRDNIRKALAIAPAATESSFTPLPMEKQPPVAVDNNSKVVERQPKAETEAAPPVVPSIAAMVPRPKPPDHSAFLPVPFGPYEFFATAAEHAFGNLCVAAGQYGPAIKSYSNVLVLNPNDYFAYYRRGNTYVRAGMKDLAIEDYNHALSLNPRFKAAATKRQKVLSEMNAQ